MCTTCLGADMNKILDIEDPEEMLNWRLLHSYCDKKYVYFLQDTYHGTKDGEKRLQMMHQGYKVSPVYRRIPKEVFYNG